MSIIRTNSLSKVYNKFKAVDNVSIEAGEGEIYGFLGLNGAGKTTTIRMLLGMIKPTVGTVRLFDKDIKTNLDLWNQVGYLVETARAYPDLTVKENLEIYFYYRKLKDRTLIESVISKLSLVNYENIKAKYLSLGNVQRLGLAKALMHKPKLLILDEPTNGLDPSGIVEIRELLRKMAGNGTTIFISSHILGEISRISNRIGIIHDGKVVKEMFTANLEKEVKRSLIIETSDNDTAQRILAERGFRVSSRSNGNIEIDDAAAIENRENISSVLIKSGLGLRQLSVYTEDLESYFLRTIKEKDVL